MTSGRMNIEIVEDNKDEILRELQIATQRALETVGLVAEGHVKSYEYAVDTGTLRNSITHALEGDDTVAIGTNIEYAPYVEFGTGIYADEGGRQTPWRYQDAKGNWHITNGQKPVHFLKNGIMNHLSEYENIINEMLSE